LDEHQNYNNQEFSRIGSSYSRRYGGSSDHLPGIMHGGAAPILPSYQQQFNYLDSSVPSGTLLEHFLK